VSRVRGVFLIILTFFCAESSAQVLVGPVISGHTGWLKYKDSGVKDVAFKVKPSWGYSVGASVSFRVRKRFFLQTSILYTRKSKILKGIEESDQSDGDFSNEMKLNFLEMPILYTAEFKGKLGKKSNREFKWYLGAGPTISYWLGGKGVLSDGDLLENHPNNNPFSYKITFNKKYEDVKRGEMNVDDPNRIQLGLNLSAGLILEPVGFNKIMIAMRYEFGHSFLSRTNDGFFGGFDGLHYSDELQVRMRTINLALHYYIDLKTDQRSKGKSTIKTKKGKLQKRRK
jgi:hypothetical protein